MKKSLILVFLLLSTFVSAIEIDEDEIKANLDKIDLQEMPTVLKFMLGKPRININVDGEVYGFRVAGNKVKEFVKGGIEKPNYVVKMDGATLEEIMSSEDISSKIGELYLKSRIDVEAKTYGTRVKYFFAKKIVRWFD